MVVRIEIRKVADGSDAGLNHPDIATDVLAEPGTR
jgi:hypothetical protein